MATIQIDTERCQKCGKCVQVCPTIFAQDAIAKLLKLPPDHKIYAGLAIGYPRVRYHNWIERKPAQIQWVEKLKLPSEHEAQAVSAAPA